VSRAWAIRDDRPQRIDHTGLAGAGVGLALAGALAALVVTTDTSLGNRVGWFIWLVLYPLSPLIGYDLATRRAGATEEPLLLAGGYAVAVAAAHLAMAAGIAVCAALDLDSHSPLWMMVLALCVVVVAAARAVAVRAANGFRGGGWALMGAAAFILLMAWVVYLVAAGFWLARIDS
jgi:hypothetical protein